MGGIFGAAVIVKLVTAVTWLEAGVGGVNILPATTY
jgi:hypothetical protein